MSGSSTSSVERERDLAVDHAEHPQRPAVEVDRRGDQRGVDPVEVVVGDDERRQAVDGERGVGAGRGDGVDGRGDLASPPRSTCAARPSSIAPPEAAADDREARRGRRPGPGTSGAPRLAGDRGRRRGRRRAAAAPCRRVEDEDRERRPGAPADTSTERRRAAGERAGDASSPTPTIARITRDRERRAGAARAARRRAADEHDDRDDDDGQRRLVVGAEQRRP